MKDRCVAKYVWQKVNESVTATVDGIMIDTLIGETCHKRTDVRKEEIKERNKDE